MHCISIEILPEPAPIKSLHPARNARLPGLFQTPPRLRETPRPRLHHRGVHHPGSTDRLAGEQRALALDAPPPPPSDSRTALRRGARRGDKGSAPRGDWRRRPAHRPHRARYPRCAAPTSA